MEYLRNPMFWIAVVVVSVVVHFLWAKFMPSMGGGTS
jgi:hypothetical protein